jgi:hypothetical protein
MPSQSNEITFTITPERIRQLGSIRGSQMTSEQARAFLLLFESELVDMLGLAFKQFVEAKLK